MIAEIKEQIQQAIYRNDAKQLRECFYNLKSLTLTGTNFDRSDFKFFIELLEHKNFLKLGGGWYFVMVFALDRDNLPFHQSEEIASAIPIAYDALKQLSLDLITEAIEEAIHSGQEMQMSECVDTISYAISHLSYFPEQYFNLILELLKKESFLKANGSFYLF